MKLSANHRINGLNKLSKLAWLLLLCLTSRLYANTQDIHFSIATAQLPPYVYLDENKEIKGLFVDLLAQAQQRSSLKIKIYVMPWGRALSEVKANRLDAVMPALWSDERAKFLVYPKRAFYALKNSVLIKRADDDFTFKGFDSIGKQKIIGKERLVLLDPEFDLLVKQGKLSVYETTRLSEALLMLDQNKIDLVASDQGIALTTIGHLDLGNKFTLYPLTMNTPSSYIAFSREFAQKHDINRIMDIIAEQAVILHQKLQ